MPNGNHGTHNSYDMSSYNGNHQQSHHQQYQQSQQQSYANNTSTNASTKSNESSAPVNKDEVGWYFVEQYYKHLSGGPDKLYVGHEVLLILASNIDRRRCSTPSARSSSSARRPTRLMSALAKR